MSDTPTNQTTAWRWRDPPASLGECFWLMSISFVLGWELGKMHLDFPMLLRQIAYYWDGKV